jgi:hypothetical protein
MEFGGWGVFLRVLLELSKVWLHPWSGLSHTWKWAGVAGGSPKRRVPFEDPKQNEGWALEWCRGLSRGLWSQLQ